MQKHGAKDYFVAGNPEPSLSPHGAKRSTPSGGKIAILTKTYPKVSETFILGEILELERKGLNLHVFSLSSADSVRSHSHTSDVRAEVDYVPQGTFFNALQEVGLHFRLFITRPFRYIKSFFFLWKNRDSNRREIFFQTASLTRMLLDAKIVHVHAHFANYPVSVAELVEQLVGIPYSISAHAKDIFLSSPESLRRKMRRARFTATCTEYNRQYLQDIAGVDARVLRVYHGMDAQRFQPSNDPAEPTKPKDAPLILSVGRLREKKGFPALIEACRLLREAGVSFHCQIIGEGPERERLAQQITLAGLNENIELIGKLFHDELIVRYRITSIFVLPCQIANDGDRDGLPNVLLEAMAMRIPVVSTDVSAVPEAVINGENGILVPQKAPLELSVALRTLLENPAERARLGRAGRKTVVQDFSSSKNLEPLFELLRQASRAETCPSTLTAEKGGIQDAS